MVHVVVEINYEQNVELVFHEIMEMHQGMTFITRCYDRKLLIFKFNKYTTKQVMNDIMQIPDIITVMVDDFDFMEC
jgi:hypothetical protein